MRIGFLLKHGQNPFPRFNRKPVTVLEAIYQTRENVLHQILQTLRSRLKKRGAAEFFETTSRCFNICDETHFRVFDMASQMINNS